jgi:hypothetical protein
VRAAPLIGSHSLQSQTAVIHNRAYGTDVALPNSASAAVSDFVPSSSVVTSSAHPMIFADLRLWIFTVTPFTASETRFMISRLLSIPRHFSWIAYARVSSDTRILPAINFFNPKVIRVQRWYCNIFIGSLSIYSFV